MAIYAVRKGDESNDRLQQRFKAQVQKTGILKMLRERSRYKRPLTKRGIRLRALKREEFRAMNRKRKFYSNM
jgi:ribosomal protein S21